MTQEGSSRWALALMWAILVLVLSTGLWRGIWTPDEPREAGMGREMSEHPGFIPLLNGRPFYEKPPLYYWTLAAAYELAGGPSAAAARAVSLVSCLLILAVTYLGMRRAAGAGPAATSIAILATCVGFFRGSQWILLDPLLALWMTLALWGAFECLSGQSLGGWLLMVGGLSLAIWTKGLIGAIFFLPGWAAFLLVRRKEGLLRRLRPVATGAALAVAALGCLAGFWIGGGRNALYQFFWVNHVDRFLHPVATGHAEPWSYYLTALPASLLPWTLLLPALARPAFWRNRGDAEKPLLRPFLGWTALGGLLLLSAAATKRETYLLPLLPALASLLGLAVYDAFQAVRGESRYSRWVLCYLDPWIPALWAVLPTLAVWAYFGTFGPAEVFFLGLGSFLACAGIVTALRSRPERAFRWQALSAAVGCASILLIVVPPVDRMKDLRPLISRMEGAVPEKQTLFALSADETLYGIIFFVTGRDVVGLSEDEFVVRALSGRRPKFLVEQEDMQNHFPRNPGILGYEVVMEEEFGPRRTIRLWRDASAPKSLEAEWPLPRPRAVKSG